MKNFLTPKDLTREQLSEIAMYAMMISLEAPERKNKHSVSFTASWATMQALRECLREAGLTNYMLEAKERYEINLICGTGS